MRNNWLWLVDLDGGSPYIFSAEPVAFYSIGGHVYSHITSFMDNSLHQFRHLSAPGSVAAVEGALSHVAKLAGALGLLLSGRSRLNMEIAGNTNGGNVGKFEPFTHVRSVSSPSGQNFKSFCLGLGLGGESGVPVLFGKLSSFLSKLVCSESEKLRSYSVLSLAAAFIPPLDNLSSKVLAVPLENSDMIVQRSCEVHQECSGLAFPDLTWRKHAIEPRTGIEFPMILGNLLAGENNSNLCSEVLVGTGSRTMTIIKIKSLKIYAFGFYVHPSSVCEKLGPKYASFSVDELDKRRDFYDDLLREDISMSVRLVVSCNGMKINTVRDAFEKSLRARLVKANPATDFHCIQSFGSCFTRDIPLPLGTTIDFRRTSDGQFITEIGGNQVGAVQSKDLCRAFFSMYIGDVPVSEQTKEDIGKNVANMIRRC